MLAIAHPFDHPPAPDIVHRPPLSSSSSSSTSFRNNKPHSTPISNKRPPTTSSTTRPSVQIHTTTKPGTPPPPLPIPAAPPPPAVNIDSYPAPELLRLLASLLAEIAATNDSLSPLPSPTSPHQPHQHHIHPHTHTALWPTLTTASRTALTTPASTLTFHARNVPTISLESYLLRILKYCPTTNEVFLSLLVYFDRMSKLSNDAVGRGFVIDSYNIHRLVIAGVTVASKFFSDVFYTNSRYAKVGGLPLAELNQLELQFLLLNDFRLVISTAEMQRYAEQLILFSTAKEEHQPNGHAHPPPPPSPSPSPSPHPTHATLHQMGAIDAYGGSLPGPSSQPQPTTHPPDEARTPNVTTNTVSFPSSLSFAHPLQHMHIPCSSDSEASCSSSGTHHPSSSPRISRRDTEPETETETETETEADTETTDDEPTIRPGSVYSFGGADAGSVYSVDSVTSVTNGVRDRDGGVYGNGQPRCESRASTTTLWDTGDEAGDEDGDEGEVEWDEDDEREDEDENGDGDGLTRTVDNLRTPGSAIGIRRVREREGSDASTGVGVGVVNGMRRVRRRVRGSSEQIRSHSQGHQGGEGDYAMASP
ncbi:PHO85 cyclin-7 [Hypsizygus marmoreus]|uniref:PHO85 cyclin-7 n=1 Tax=Hypsizygus marmoreus TaxID=39966 RepID=A0A369JGJ7_HYPMA|nr:PHO85 cyclin-7 [Hypsizygus marmoreus]